MFYFLAANNVALYFKKEELKKSYYSFYTADMLTCDYRNICDSAGGNTNISLAISQV